MDARGTERTNRVGPENPYVASTPTYSQANNGAFTLKRRVVILYIAAALFPDSIYNHQSKSPIFFAQILHFFHPLAIYHATIYNNVTQRDYALRSEAPPPQHPTGPPIDSLMFNSHVNDDNERLSRGDERWSDVLIVDFLRAAQSTPAPHLIPTGPRAVSAVTKDRVAKKKLKY